MMLMGSRTDDRKKAISLDPDGLLHHTLVVGQSGSGKSFLIARLVEEILINTASRVVIVDPNGDFRGMSSVSPTVWGDEGIATVRAAYPRDPDYDAKEKFESTWRERRFLHLHPNAAYLPPDSPTVLHRRLFIHWDALEEEDRDFLLRSQGRLGPGTTLGLDACWGNMAFLRNLPDAPFGPDLRGMANAAEQFAARNINLHYYEYAKHLTADDWNGVRATIADLLRQHTIWWSKSPQQPARPYGIDFYIHGPYAGDPPESESFWDLLVLALDAAKASDTLLVVYTALSRIWREAKAVWRDTSRTAGATDDSRVPTFVIIDEAQRFAPTQTNDPLRRRVTEQLLQIAAEGRKYGIYLVLATQRPTKLHPELVPECENSCVLRVQSNLDAEFASNALGIDREMVNSAKKFRQGRGLISGRWIDNDTAVDTQFAPSRTVVGGGGLSSKWQTRSGTSSPYIAAGKRIRDYVLGLLNESEDPITLVDLAAAVRSDFPECEEDEWGGKGSFKAFLASLQIRDLQIDTTTPPGFARLPNQTEVPRYAPPVVPRELFAAMLEIRAQTDIPILEERSYAAVLKALSDEVTERAFNLTDVTRSIRDRLRKENIHVSRVAISYIVKGIGWSGHRFDPDLPQDPKTLARAFVRQLIQSIRTTPLLEGELLVKALAYCVGNLLSLPEVSLIAQGTGRDKTEPLETPCAIPAEEVAAGGTSVMNVGDQGQSPISRTP